MLITNKDLGKYINLSFVIKEFNNKYRSIYPKLTKSKAIALCKANSIPLYSFSQSVNIRSRIYISKLINLEDFVAEDFKEIFIETRDCDNN